MRIVRMKWKNDDGHIRVGTIVAGAMLTGVLAVGGATAATAGNHGGGGHHPSPSPTVTPTPTTEPTVTPTPTTEPTVTPTPTTEPTVTPTVTLPAPLKVGSCYESATLTGVEVDGVSYTSEGVIGDTPETKGTGTLSLYVTTSVNVALANGWAEENGVIQFSWVLPLCDTGTTTGTDTGTTTGTTTGTDTPTGTAQVDTTPAPVTARATGKTD